MQDLLRIMSTLRDPEKGCPWDQKQTLASLVPFTIEEAYEVADAIHQHDHTELRDELGDLLFQVVFYAQLGMESGHFDFEDVVQSICDKLIRRHPHVFADAKFSSAEEQTANWETLKEQERKARDHASSVLDGVSKALPALSRAQKIQRRAARVGFDWDNIQDVVAKILEEVEECQQAQSEGNERMEEEIGDLLFACVNLARHHDIDAEAALRKATGKFEQRFHQVEKSVEQSNRSWDEHTLAELDRYWEASKK